MGNTQAQAQTLQTAGMEVIPRGQTQLFLGNVKQLLANVRRHLSVDCARVLGGLVGGCLVLWLVAVWLELCCVLLVVLRCVGGVLVVAWSITASCQGPPLCHWGGGFPCGCGQCLVSAPGASLA